MVILRQFIALGYVWWSTLTILMISAPYFVALGGLNSLLLLRDAFSGSLVKNAFGAVPDPAVRPVLCGDGPNIPALHAVQLCRCSRWVASTLCADRRTTCRCSRCSCSPGLPQTAIHRPVLLRVGAADSAANEDVEHSQPWRAGHHSIRTGDFCLALPRGQGDALPSFSIMSSFVRNGALRPSVYAALSR